MRALLLANGDPPSRRLVRHHVRRCDFFVCADGGANAARRLGVRPDLIVGDLDSITAATRRAFAAVPTIRIARQDNTDLEKALDLLLDRGAEHVTILGAAGGRLDFTLGNLAVLWNYTARIDLLLEGDGWRALPVGRERVVEARRGTTVSLLPFGPCSGITLRGLRYPLTGASMPVGRIGVSNVVVASPFRVRVRRGRMLLILLTA
jgi:thiamine pyrophosphokinase